MAVNNNQLARIVAPSIDETDYANKMATAFTNINDNFKKIASLPFLQGVAGDSYQLIEFKIWDLDETVSENAVNAQLTKEGAVLLNSIFNTDEFIENRSLGDYINGNGENGNNGYKILNGISPLQSFISNGKLINNTLYFYAIIDDSNEIIEDSKHLGQYFYFIDGRINTIGDVYTNSKNDLTSFVDYTGFFQYDPSTKAYYKVEILPTLYYDRDKNDICWKFNGAETGISAIGVSGADGKNAKFQYVKTQNVNSALNNSAGISYVFNVNTSNTTDYWETPTDINLSEGLAIVCITDNDNIKHAFGEIRKEGANWIAYWNDNTIVENLITNTTINQYFYKMGDAASGFPKYLAIPVNTNRDSGDKKAHVVYSKNNNDFSSLVIKGVQNAWNSSQEQTNVKNLQNHDGMSIEITNYDVNLCKNDITNINNIQGASGKIDDFFADTIDTKTITGVTGNIDNINSKNITVKTAGKNTANITSNYTTKVDSQNIIVYDSKNRPLSRIHTESIDKSTQKHAHMRISSAPIPDSNLESPFYNSNNAADKTKTQGGYLDLFAHGNDMFEKYDNGAGEIRPGIRIQDTIKNGTAEKSVNVYSTLNIRDENGNPNNTVLNVNGASNFNGVSNFNEESKFKKQITTKLPICGDNVFGFIDGDPKADDDGNNLDFKKCTNSSHKNDGWTPRYPYTYLLINNKNNHRYLMFDAKLYPQNTVVFVNITGNSVTFNTNNDIKELGIGMYAFYLGINTYTTKDGIFRKVTAVTNIGGAATYY
jgi:hypothetical protein